jgi:hypothetical protein
MVNFATCGAIRKNPDIAALRATLAEPELRRRKRRSRILPDGMARNGRTCGAHVNAGVRRSDQAGARASPASIRSLHRNPSAAKSVSTVALGARVTIWSVTKRPKRMLDRLAVGFPNGFDIGNMMAPAPFSRAGAFLQEPIPPRQLGDELPDVRCPPTHASDGMTASVRTPELGPSVFEDLS